MCTAPVVNSPLDRRLSLITRTITPASAIAGTQCMPPQPPPNGRRNSFPRKFPAICERRPDVRLRRAKVAHTRRRNTFSVCTARVILRCSRGLFFERGGFASACEPENKCALLTLSELSSFRYIHIYIYVPSCRVCLINFYAILIA